MSSRSPDAGRGARGPGREGDAAPPLELLSLLIPAACMVAFAAAAYWPTLRRAAGAAWRDVLPQAVAASLPQQAGAAAVVASTRDARPATRVLRVCADPNNLPFTNERREGFENRIADVVARELGATVEYTWWAQRRGFFRNTLNAGRCDVVLGVPSRFEMASTTRPYYRSTYVFVYRRDRGTAVRSFDDPALRRLKIGVQLIGDDYTNTPPAHALARRGITRNVVGYTVYGDYREESPPHRIVEAVARGDVDVAVVWGPLAGYYAGRSPVPLAVVPVRPGADSPALPFTFAIAMGVRRGDEALRAELNRALVRARPEIDRILTEYGVPRVDAAGNESEGPDAR